MAERANLFEKALLLLRENSVKIYSLTFDDAHVNTAMCNTLGAKLTIQTHKHILCIKFLMGLIKKYFLFMTQYTCLN